MTKQTESRWLSPPLIDDDPTHVGALRFTFVSGSNRQAYILSVRGHGDETEIKWLSLPADDSAREIVERIARKCVTARHAWIDKLRKLVATVKGWADELGWATKVVDKRMEDAEIGNYKAPALLLQHESVRLFLEPVARSTPGSDGVVDLYLMPSYDDIASLYHSGSRWHVHYLFEGTPTVGTIREAEGRPMTRATLRKVFDEMAAHAG